MSIDFKKLKAMSGKKSLEKLTEEINKFNAPQNSEDTRYWKPTVDKAGNGFAVIRFLPAHKDEDTPFIRYWDHGFEGPGGWYIEKSRTSLGQGEADPVSEYNSMLWNKNKDDESPERKQARKQKRRLHYVSNILVISDPSNPENEGKVFLFKYGKKIFNMLNDAMFPQFPDATPFDPFHFWEGANFKLKIRKVEGYPNYDKSEFEDPAPLFDDDSKIEKVWNMQYPLLPIIAPSEFKSYDELKRKLEKVLGGVSSPVSRVAAMADAEDPPFEVQPRKSKSSPPPRFEAEDDEDNESLEYFRRLAK
jgi:gp32 DNA binding protein like